MLTAIIGRSWRTEKSPAIVHPKTESARDKAGRHGARHATSWSDFWRGRSLRLEVGSDSRSARPCSAGHVTPTSLPPLRRRSSSVGPGLRPAALPASARGSARWTAWTCSLAALTELRPRGSPGRRCGRPAGPCRGTPTGRATQGVSQLPPRSTRSEPVVGPVGSSTGDALVVVLVVPVRAPLPHVPVHVVQAPSVGTASRPPDVSWR